MQDYPILRTTIPYLQLQPLQKKHLPFLVELLSEKEIQKTLFRVPTKANVEKEAHAIERMYEEVQPKEITYILTIKKLFTEKYIGYVKIKMIDWNVKNCFISIATLPGSEYRGKGYAKATYDSFFEYLFSLGIMKIYGRTYESNFSTIKLNQVTGFTFVGRQSDFILYPDDTSLDALLFEKINPILHNKYQKPYHSQMLEVAKLLEPLTSARHQNKVSKELILTTVGKLQHTNYLLLPEPLQRYLNEVIESLSEESIAKQEENIEVKSNHSLEIIRKHRAENAIASGFRILAYPITKAEQEKEFSLLNAIQSFHSLEINTVKEIDITTAIRYGSYTPENWIYLEPLFLGINAKNSIIDIQKAIKDISTAR